MAASTSRRDAPILTVSVAAELAGIHPQTVRQYDRLGLVVATRTRGGGRRYSLADVERLQEIQRLSQDEGVSLAGIARIFELQDEVERLQAQVRRLRRQVEKQGEALAAEEMRRNRVFAAGSDGDVLVAAGPSQLRERLREARRAAAAEEARQAAEAAEEARRRAEAMGADAEGMGRESISGAIVIWRPSY